MTFVNTGSSRFSIRGPVSGIEYHFERPGVQVQVDPRDQPMLSRSRQLRQVG
jgi:hypothetical protein